MTGATTTESDERAKFILIKGKAGMGNRMLAAAAGILYARLTSRRLIVDWSDPTYSNDGSNVFPSFFECPATVQEDALPATDSIAPAIWRGQLRLSVADLETQYTKPGDDRPAMTPDEFRLASAIDLTRLDHQERLLVLWDVAHRTRLLWKLHQPVVPEFPPRGSPTEILRELFWSEFVVRAPIRERVERFKRDHFCGRSVGVQVRYTDKKVRLGALLDRLDALLVDEPDLLVFLATDSAEVKERFERRYPALVTAPHWYSVAGSPIHRSWVALSSSRAVGQRPRVAPNGQCPDRFEAGIAALVDLHLLAACNHLICDTDSSFARVATLLSEAPASRVGDVRATTMG